VNLREKKNAAKHPDHMQHDTVEIGHKQVEDKNIESVKEKSDLEKTSQETDEEKDSKDHQVSKKELAAQLEKIKKENDELSDRLLRTLAEFDNYKKRVSREKEELIKYGIENFALELLPIVDNFERAREQANNAAEIGQVLEGIDMILKQLLAVLEKFQVTSFGSLGEAFDPQKHEAMAHQENDDFAENKVMAEFQKGYYLSDKLLRPARVIVSKGPIPDKGQIDKEKV
jgi:molecular chaperone GrpE